MENLQSPGFLDGIRKKGDLLREELIGLQTQFPSIIRNIRGRGLLMGAELSINGREVCERALQAGLVINNLSGNACAERSRSILRFLPPYVISEMEIRKGCRLLGDVLSGLC